MINEAYKAMLGGKSVIRELSEYATARGAEIGYENVFDYSLGNPSVPCPQDYTDAVIDMYKTAEPVALHGYSPSLGISSVRKAIAESLNRRPTPRTSRSTSTRSRRRSTPEPRPCSSTPRTIRPARSIPLKR